MSNKRIRIFLSLGGLMVAGAFFLTAFYEACRNPRDGVDQPSKPTTVRHAVAYAKAIEVNGPDNPYRGALRLEYDVISNQGRTELIVNTIRPAKAGSILYAQHFRPRCMHKAESKIRLTPLQAHGMIGEWVRGGVAIGMLRYRIDGDGPFNTNDIGKLIVEYLDQDYRLSVRNVRDTRS